MSKENGKLDFLIIGAQKSGTTTLYQLLREHPQVFMPQQKEIGFFSNPRDDKYSMGFSAYLEQYFSDAKHDEIIGEASPQYMCCLYAAKRIAQDAPAVKLIAVLRNPIDRSYSAHKMLLRLGEENRTFNEVVESQLGESGIREIGEQEYLSRTDSIRPSLYGKILAEYQKLFSRDQIHICFMEDLEKNPAVVMRGIYRFLGVDNSYVPHSVNKKFHVGGQVKYRLIANFHAFLRGFKSYLPDALRKKLAGSGYWLQQWNVKKEVGVIGDHQLRMRLAKFYAPDIALLKQQFSLEVPWKEFR